MDFTFGEGKAPNRYKEQEIMPFFDAPGKHRLVPCMAFFGANASGKTAAISITGNKKVTEKISVANQAFKYTVTAGKKTVSVVIAGKTYKFTVTVK